MATLVKNTRVAISSYLTLMVPVTIVGMAVVGGIGLVGHVPGKNVKVCLEMSGTEVVKRYHELNKNNTLRLQRENTVKFSTEKAHGAEFHK